MHFIPWHRTALAVMVLLVGCATSSVQRLSTKTYPPKPSTCAVEVFTDPSRVEKKYVEIALITHKTKQDAFSDKGAANITNALLREACKQGADGMIIKSISQGTWGDPGRGEAIAIKYEP